MRLRRSRVGARGRTGSLGSIDWAAKVAVPAGGLGAADFQSVGRGAGGCTGMVRVENESLRRVEEVVGTVMGGGLNVRRWCASIADAAVVV